MLVIIKEVCAGFAYAELLLFKNPLRHICMETSLILEVLFHLKAALVSIWLNRLASYTLISISIHHYIVLTVQTILCMWILLCRLKLSQCQRIVLTIRQIVRISSSLVVSIDVSTSLHLTMLLISSTELVLESLKVAVVLLSIGIQVLALWCRHWSSSFLILVGYTCWSFAEHVALDLRLRATDLIVPIVCTLVHAMKFTEIGDGATKSLSVLCSTWIRIQRRILHTSTNFARWLCWAMLLPTILIVFTSFLSWFWLFCSHY